MELADAARLPTNQAEFDRSVVTELARMHVAIQPLIMEQFRQAEVTQRHGSRVGCFTHFAVPDECTPLPSDIKSPLDGPDFRLRGVSPDFGADSGETGFGLAGSLLFLDQGKICMLECHAYGGGWPEDHYDFEFVPTRSD